MRSEKKKKKKMNVISLGSGGFHDSEERHTCCFMIPDLGIIFDAGSGFFRAPQFVKTEIMNIFISHCHLDHVMNISHITRLKENQICKYFVIYASLEVLGALKPLLEPPFSPFPVIAKMVEVKPGVQVQVFHSLDSEKNPQSCTTVVTPFQVSHGSTNCLGFHLSHDEVINRIVFQHSMAYITDSYTTPYSPYLPLLNRINLLLLDAFYPSELAFKAENSGHSTGKMVGEIGKIVQPQKLVLIHINPKLDNNVILNEAKENFENVELATDLHSYSF